MAEHPLAAPARRLRALHQGSALVLPNVWDAASAAIIVAAGARAVATTSAGVSWALGHPDGERLSRTEMADMVRRIVAAVDVPVITDIASGYGTEPKHVGVTVHAIMDAGAVGACLGDARPDGSPFPPSQQSQRLIAAREAAAAFGVPEFVLTARTDVFRLPATGPSGRLGEVLVRADAYAASGADILYVPGLLDLDLLATLVAATPLPIEVMICPGGPTIADLRAVGVRRISVGAAIARAAYTLARRAARELLESGTCQVLADAAAEPELNVLFQ
jgi:2-methylisocitrate lyase-like PEP mutase family enzyme